MKKGVKEKGPENGRGKVTLIKSDRKRKNRHNQQHQDRHNHLGLFFPKS